MIDLDNRALFPLETGYAVDLPSPLREYPPSSLHVSSSSPPASPRPYAAPDSVCARQRQRQQEPQGGRGWEASDSHQGQGTTYPPYPQAAPAAARIPPAQLVVVGCVPAVRLTPAAAALGIGGGARAFAACMHVFAGAFTLAGLACGVGSSHRSPAPTIGLCSGYGGEDHLYHLANSWELVASRRIGYQ
jgi:hypothetical protein